MKLLNKRMAIWAAAGLMAGSIGLGASTLTQAAQPLATPAATGPATRPHQERHPEIHRALAGLREAKRALEKADHDFKGHREAALKDTEEAIKECEECLKVDAK